MNPESSRHPKGLQTSLSQLSRTLVMGVVNVTPDSFSDGGRYVDTDKAITHGFQLLEDGADIIDIGGESTRPGAQRVSVDEELRRVIPVIKALAKDGVVVSIDTMRADVAQAAHAVGASIINDVSAGQADSQMLATVARMQTPFISMHWRGHSTEMSALTDYQDVVTDVMTEMQTQVTRAIDAGIDVGRIVLDPGIGFAKTVDQNWPLLAHINKFVQLGHPLLVGVSRKRFLGELLSKDGEVRPVDQREHATTALTTFLTSAGVWCVRVHDVKAARDAIAVVERLRVS